MTETKRFFFLFFSFHPRTSLFLFLKCVSYQGDSFLWFRKTWLFYPRMLLESFNVSISSGHGSLSWCVVVTLWFVLLNTSAQKAKCTYDTIGRRFYCVLLNLIHAYPLFCSHLVNMAQVLVIFLHRILYGVIPLFEITTCAYFPLLVS
jgi:hypothetical protein